MASKIISSWISSGADDKNVAQRVRSQQQQQHQHQPPQHKTLTKVNSGPGSTCETYLGSDKQLYCDKNLQQTQNISTLRPTFNPSYMCHSCLRGGGQLVRPVSLVAPDVEVTTGLRPSVKRSVSYHHQRQRDRRGARPVVRSDTLASPPGTKAGPASDYDDYQWWDAIKYHGGGHFLNFHALMCI